MERVEKGGEKHLARVKHGAGNDGKAQKTTRTLEKRIGGKQSAAVRDRAEFSQKKLFEGDITTNKLGNIYKTSRSTSRPIQLQKQERKNFRSEHRHFVSPNHHITSSPVKFPLS
jgi:hypothetical protein